jgi:hypothetical protein
MIRATDPMGKKFYWFNLDHVVHIRCEESFPWTTIRFVDGSTMHALEAPEDLIPSCFTAPFTH